MPKFQRLDNKISTLLKDYLAKENVDPSVPSIHDSKGDDDVTLSDDPGYVPDT